MSRSDRSFVIAFAVILVVGSILVGFGIRSAGIRAAEDGARMQASAEAARGLLQLHYAMNRYRVDAGRDPDHDGQGGFAPLDQIEAAGLLDEDWQPVASEEGGGLQRQGYRYRAFLPAEADAAEQRFVVVALPRQRDWPVMAIDQAGDIRLAPPGFVPGEGGQVDPGAWPTWR